MFKLKSTLRNADAGLDAGGGAPEKPNPPQPTPSSSAAAPTPVDVQAEIDKALAKQFNRMCRR